MAPDGLRYCLGERFNPMNPRLDTLDLDPQPAGFSAVIYGHSHQPEIDYMQESVTIGLNIVDSNATIC